MNDDRRHGQRAGFSPDRIEAAARADWDSSGLFPAFDQMDEMMQGWACERVRRVLEAAFPELAGEHPSHWLAPMEASEKMVDGYERRSRGSRPCKGIPPFTDSKGHRCDGAQNAWDAFRDAHLKEKQT